ncbi:MAG TPA: SpoIID/LytB domain-containing protein [Gemmatimonadaceae bacterium]|nr:SpoIID/LytB domain-containing protein [Gemmatimonadaceae bacterium]
MTLLAHAPRRGAVLTCIAALLLAACSESPTAPEASRTAPSGIDAAEAAANFDGNIRIGVVPSASSIEIGSDAAWSIHNKRTSELLMSGSGDAATVTLGSTASIRENYRLQVACTGDEAYRDSWVANVESQGYVAYTEFVAGANCWRLFVGEFAPDASFSIRNAFRNEVIAKGLAGTDSFWKVVTIIDGVTTYKVTHGADEVISTDPPVLDAGGATVRINGTEYRGVAEVILNGSGTLAGVNELPLEEYLYGVVPRELPPVPYGEPEAQKAQAVAARTYALRGLGKRSSDGYDLLPTTSDQVYGGYSAEQAVSTAAVDATRGIVAVKGGQLIDALFSSTTGGWTANNEEVFNSAPIDYLRSVPDEERGAALENVPSLEVFRNAGNPRSLRAEHSGSFESDWSRYHRWTFEWTAQEISDVLSAAYGQPVGTVYEINVLKRGPSGRVMEIEFVTDAGRFYQTKDRIRSTLRYINADGAQASLLSTLFYIEPVMNSATNSVSGFRVYGGGWGHGVGMGQTGAVGMADKGASYDAILKHYYQGIDLVAWY